MFGVSLLFIDGHSGKAVIICFELCIYDYYPAVDVTQCRATLCLFSCCEVTISREHCVCCVLFNK